MLARGPGLRHRSWTSLAAVALIALAAGCDGLGLGDGPRTDRRSVLVVNGDDQPYRIELEREDERAWRAAPESRGWFEFSASGEATITIRLDDCEVVGQHVLGDGAGRYVIEIADAALTVSAVASFSSASRLEVGELCAITSKASLY